MKHLAVINVEFLKTARKWDDLSYEDQKGYLKRHPGSKRKLTAKPESSKKTDKKDKKKVVNKSKEDSTEKSKHPGPKGIRQPFVGEEEGTLTADDKSKGFTAPLNTEDRKHLAEVEAKLPEDQKKYAKYLTPLNEYTHTFELLDTSGDRPIIKHDRPDEKAVFEVPNHVKADRGSIAGRSRIGIGGVTLSQFDSLEDAKKFLANADEMEHKAVLRQQISDSSHKINRFAHDQANEANLDSNDINSILYRSTRPQLANVPFKLSEDDTKKIISILNNPGNVTSEDIEFCQNNLDNVVSDLKSASNSLRDYDKDRATNFINKVDTYKKILTSVKDDVVKREQLIKEHGTETKDNIKLPEGFKFADKTTIGNYYDDRYQVRITNDDKSIEIMFNFDSPDAWDKYNGEVYYTVPSKSGTYSLGARGVDFGIMTSWSDIGDVNDMIKSKIDVVKKKQEKIARSLSVKVGDSSWSLTPERIEEMKQKFAAGKSVTFAPHGMGIGYFVSTKPGRYSKPLNQESNDLFGVKLYAEQYDHD